MEKKKIFAGKKTKRYPSLRGKQSPRITTASTTPSSTFRRYFLLRPPQPRLSSIFHRVYSCFIARNFASRSSCCVEALLRFSPPPRAVRSNSSPMEACRAPQGSARFPRYLRPRCTPRNRFVARGDRTSLLEHLAATEQPSFAFLRHPHPPQFSAYG